MKRKVKPEIDWLYETRCDRCGGKATTAYTVYSQVFQCPRCLEECTADCPEIESATKEASVARSGSAHCYSRGIVERSVQGLKDSAQCQYW